MFSTRTPACLRGAAVRPESVGEGISTDLKSRMVQHTVHLRFDNTPANGDKWDRHCVLAAGPAAWGSGSSTATDQP